MMIMNGMHEKIKQTGVALRILHFGGVPFCAIVMPGISSGIKTPSFLPILSSIFIIFVRLCIVYM